MIKMLRNHGNLKKDQEFEPTEKQKEIFLLNGFAEEVKCDEPCDGCKDQTPCSECEKHAKSKQRVVIDETENTIQSPIKSKQPKTPKAPKK